MNYQVSFRDHDNLVGEDDKTEFRERIKDFMSSLPEDAYACCCIQPFPKHLKLHLVVESASAGRFEGSVSAKTTRALFLALWNHFQPQFSRWKLGRIQRRGREKMNHSVSTSDPVKCQICTAENCPMVQSHGRWPGQTG